MGNASEASQSEFIAALRAIRDRLNESSNAGPINVVFFRDDNIQVNVEDQGGIVLRGEKTDGTDEIPLYRAAPANLLTAATDRGRPKALDYSTWSLDVESGSGSTVGVSQEADTGAPILPVYVEPDPYRLQWKYTHETGVAKDATEYDWFSPAQLVQ